MQPAQVTGGRAIASSIRAAAAGGRPALIPFVTAGFPAMHALAAQLRSLAPHAAAIEIGVPFSDPMADGMTIQRASRAALAGGATLSGLLDVLSGLRSQGLPPLLLMSYLNPLLPMGLEGLADRCAAAGVAALIVPDLPLDESDVVRKALHARGVGLVSMVTPVTEPERARRLALASDGFLYAVTMTGVTGASGTPGAADGQLTGYLDSLRAISPVPVAAGFGIRSPQQVRALAGHADACIVGSAVIETIERGEDPGAFLASLGA